MEAFSFWKGFVVFSDCYLIYEDVIIHVRFLVHCLVTGDHSFDWTWNYEALVCFSAKRITTRFYKSTTFSFYWNCCKIHAFFLRSSTLHRSGHVELLCSAITRHLFPSKPTCAKQQVAYIHSRVKGEIIVLNDLCISTSGSNVITAIFYT